MSSMRTDTKRSLLSRQTRAALPGTVWIVTGSSRGIGRTAARMLLQAGASVVLHGRNAASLAQLAAACAEEGFTSTASCAGDIQYPETAQELVQLAHARFGRLDGVIANAGISMRGDFCELNPSVMQQIIQIDLLGTAYTLRAALPALRATDGYAAVVSSLAGLRGFPHVSVYSAARMGISGLCESINAELSRSRMRICLCFLGFTRNDPEKYTLNAAGERQQHRRTQGATQQESAAAVIQGAVKRRRTVVTTAAGRLFYTAQLLAPGIVGWIIRRSGGRVHRR